MGGIVVALNGRKLDFRDDAALVAEVNVSNLTNQFKFGLILDSYCVRVNTGK